MDNCIGRRSRITRSAFAISRPRRRNVRKLNAGEITANNASRASSTKRHRLSVSQWVAPGGKNLRLQEQALQQQCCQDFCLHPSAGRLVITFRNMPSASKTFKPFEG